MNHHSIKIYHWLSPFARLYGLGVGFRNKLFDWGILQSKSFDIPIICVGNLAVGGTGKTPHTEYLIKLLQNQNLKIAMLSRGYKRLSKGYLLASEKTDVQSIGDEPYQIKSKFPHIQVAVDEKRCHGIEQLMQLHTPCIQVVLLDDAYQHRYVKPGLSILLTDYHRLFCDDALLPAGLLREPASGKGRAQIVIVTKCPKDLKPIDYKIITKRMELYPYQQLYFSTFSYGDLTPLFPDSGKKTIPLASLQRTSNILVVTGIASPAPLKIRLKKYVSRVELMTFKDHHNFNENDLHLIRERFELLPSKQKWIVITEKDATKLRSHPALNEALKPHIYVLPVEIVFLQSKQEIFNQNIIDYVRTYPRNSGLPQK